MRSPITPLGPKVRVAGNRAGGFRSPEAGAYGEESNLQEFRKAFVCHLAIAENLVEEPGADDFTRVRGHNRASPVLVLQK